MSKRYPKKDQYWDELYRRHSGSSVRCFVDLVEPGWVVRTAWEGCENGYAGLVGSVVRDEYGLAVQLKCYTNSRTKAGRDIRRWTTLDIDDVKDYSLENLWYVNHDHYTYQSKEEIDKEYASCGFYWDNNRGCYYNPETGEESCY